MAAEHSGGPSREQLIQENQALREENAQLWNWLSLTIEFAFWHDPGQSDFRGRGRLSGISGVGPSQSLLMTVILALHKALDVPQDEFRLIIGNGPLGESFPGQYRPDEVNLLIMLGSHWYLGLPGLLDRVEDHFQCLTSIAAANALRGDGSTTPRVASRRVGRHTDHRFSILKRETASISLLGGRGSHARPLKGRAWLPLDIMFILERTIADSTAGNHMHSQRQAYNKFDRETDYLCEVVDAYLKPQPSFGHDSPSYSLKIVLVVRARVLDKARSTTSVGEQAVTWAAVDRDLGVVGDLARFVRDLGVRLMPRNKPDLTPGRVVACRFGEPDPEFGYQPIVSCRVVDSAQYHLVRVARPRRRRPPCIDWDETLRDVWRTTKPTEKVSFGRNAIPFKLFTYIAEQGEQYCSYNALIDLIMEVKRSDDPVDVKTILKHAEFIRRKISPLGLGTDCLPSHGYRIVKTTDGGALDAGKKRRRRGG